MHVASAWLELSQSLKSIPKDERERHRETETERERE